MRGARMGGAVVALALGVAVLLAPAAWAGQVHEVTLNTRRVPGRAMPEFFFDPVGLFIQPGDAVVFKAIGPRHTVTAYHPAYAKVQRVPDGVAPFSSPVIAVGDSWQYTFTVPGVYDVWCLPHEMYGMVMRVVVGTPTGPGATPSTDLGSGGTLRAAGQILNHPLLAPERIMAQGSVPWAAIPEELKRADAR